MDSKQAIRTCPVGIEILMHLYYSPEPSSFEGTQVYHETLREWGDAGIVEWIVPSGSWHAGWTLTQKGKAWVELICSTPYPVSDTIWKDPRTNERIGDK